MGKGQGTPTQPTSPQSAYSGSFGNYGGFGGFGGFGQQNPMGSLPGGPQPMQTQSQAMAQMPMGAPQNMQNAFQQFQQAQNPMGNLPGGQSLGSFGAQPQQAPSQNMQDAFQQFQQAQNLMGSLPGGQQPPMTQSQAMAQMPMGGQPLGMMGNLPGGPQAPLSQDQMQQRAQMMAGAQQALNPYNSGQYNQPGAQGGSFMQNLGMLGMQQPMGLGALPPRMPQAPMAQQIRQEDPRMQAMRNMQRMSGSGGRVEGINPNVRSV